MTEVDLVTALNSLVGNRVFPDVAPFNTATPYILYQQVGGQAVNFITAEASSKKNARIQIEVWSATRSESMTMIRQIEDLLAAAPFNAYIESAAVAHRDNTTDLRGAIQDFSMWIG